MAPPAARQLQPHVATPTGDPCYRDPPEGWGRWGRKPGLLGQGVNSGAGSSQTSQPGDSTADSIPLPFSLITGSLIISVPTAPGSQEVYGRVPELCLFGIRIILSLLFLRKCSHRRSSANKLPGKFTLERPEITGETCLAGPGKVYLLYVSSFHLPVNFLPLL